MLKNMRTLTILSIAFAGIGLSACETVGGAGRDIENAGEVVQDAAD
jgi:predicted small secreted protein